MQSAQLVCRSVLGRRRLLVAEPQLWKNRRLSSNSSNPTGSGKPPPSQSTPKVAAEETTTTKQTTEKNLSQDPPLTNPFPLLAHATENIDLSSRLRAFANNFAVIGALWCTLSITALSMAPLDDVYKDTERIDTIVEPANQTNTAATVVPFVRWRKVTSRAAAVATNQQQPATNQEGTATGGRRTKRRPPVLVKYFGVPEHHLENIYMACWSASFFTSAIGLGLSTVVAGIVASTAPSYVKVFVRRHSDILLALPFCQGLSSGLAAVGLTVGLDEARGEPVSWIGYVGTVAGGLVVGQCTLKVLRGYKDYRAAGKLINPTKDG